MSINALRRNQIITLIAITLWLCLDFAFAEFNGDRLLVLTFAHWIVEGKQPYVDFVDVNPPLIMWLYVIPAALSRLNILSDVTLLVMGGLTALAAISLMTFCLIKKSDVFMTDTQARDTFLLFIVATFIIFVQPVHIAEREYVFSLLTLPYVLRFMPSLADKQYSRRLRIGIGIAAGIGFSMKPYCLIVLGGIQLLFLLRHRSLRILYSLENLILYGFICIYVTLICVFFPEYISIVLPLTIPTYADTFTQSSLLSILIMLPIPLLSLALFTGDFRLRQQSPYRHDILYFLCITVLCFIYIFLNKNIDERTYIPFNTVIIIMGGLIVLHLTYRKTIEQSETRKIQQALTACKAAFILNAAKVFLYIYFAAGYCSDIYRCEAGKQFIKEIVAINDNRMPKSFGTISEGFRYWVAFERETHSKLSTRFISLYMLPAFFIENEAFRQTYSWIPRYVSDAYAEDLHNNTPEIVLVQNRDVFLTINHYVDLIAYLSQFSAFRQEWEHYSFIKEIPSPIASPTAFVAHSPSENTLDKQNRNGYYVYKRNPQ